MAESATPPIRLTFRPSDLAYWPCVTSSVSTACWMVTFSPLISVPVLDRMSEPVLFRIADEWSLTDREAGQLLGMPVNEVSKLRAGRKATDHGTVARLSYLFGIYGSLAVLLPIPEHAHAWPKRPTPRRCSAGSVLWTTSWAAGLSAWPR